MPGLTFIFHCLILIVLRAFLRVYMKVCDHVRGIFISLNEILKIRQIFGCDSSIIGGTFLIVASCLY
ncbi:hypothetical protein NC652_017205 [Populus alba x Populus x berolinensis]|nr:hypothetical protein NC652_017205 [Populus alba x Populus x berolinensis]